MKALAAFFTRLYKYSTVFIVVASPLFFIPKLSFTPEVTYHITMMIVVAVALTSYIVSALLTRSWHSVSKLEFISYTTFSLAVILSVFFARDPNTALFGEALSPLSGAALLTLPSVVYLVRTLPDTYRRKLKYIVSIMLGVAVFILSITLMINNAFVKSFSQIFLGFSNPTSFSVYLGIFVVGAFFFVKKVRLPIRQKAIIVTAALVFMAWAVSISAQEAIRPNFTSSLTVAKGVMINNGIFGIGAGDYVRAWQLYRPSAVITSPYFGMDFSQSYSILTTLFATIGIVGLITFLFLTLTALYSTFVSYRASRDKEDHVLTGFLFMFLLYFTIVSWFAPLSYAMLVVWMVVAGLGLAKAKLTEFHPSKKVGYVMVPVAVLLLINSFVTIQKVRAIVLFNEAQNMLSTKGVSDTVGSLITKASTIYNYDAFYRAQVELAILQEREILSRQSGDQEALKTEYLKRAQKAVDDGILAVKTNKNNYQNYVSLGRAYELVMPFDKEKAFENAKKSYQNAINLYPDNPYLYITLARLEAAGGTKDGVRTQLTEALKKKQNFADALYLMSQLEASDSKIDEAITYAVEAVKNAPNDPLTYIQAGLLYYGKKDYQNAVVMLNTGLQKDPNNANIAYFLALTLRDGGRADLAKTLGDELLKRNPGNADLEAFLKSLEPVQPEPQPAKKSPTKQSAKK